MHRTRFRAVKTFWIWPEKLQPLLWQAVRHRQNFLFITLSNRMVIVDAGSPFSLKKYFLKILVCRGQ